jgi:hypothetical protein
MPGLSFSERMRLARATCLTCHGAGELGVQVIRNCHCVNRHIFTACLAHYREVDRPKPASGSWTGEPAPQAPLGRRITGEDYRADFVLIARRALQARDWPVFSFHFLEGNGRPLALARLRMSKNAFTASVHRIVDLVGCAISEMQAPYALFPPCDYYLRLLKPTASPRRRRAPRKAA